MNCHTFIQSADICRFLKNKGITIRKSIDCVSAAVAIENELALHHDDRKFKYNENHLTHKVF